MSLDFYLFRTGKYDDTGEEFRDEIFSSNITHNLGKMATEAGIYEALWRPEENGFVKAEDVLHILLNGLVELKSNREKYEKFNDPDGWGMYVNFVPFVEEVLNACIENPNAKIEALR